MAAAAWHGTKCIKTFLNEKETINLKDRYDCN